MSAPSVNLGDELVTRIDKARAQVGVKTGEIPSRAEWVRQACEEQLDDVELVEEAGA